MLNEVTTHFGTGAFHGCAVLETPEIMCWGRNDEGQLGLDPATTPTATTPQLVPGLPEVERDYGGVLTTCVRTTNTRELYCWGNNDYGQLGNGTTTSSLTPVHVPEIERLGVLFPGVRHTCAYDTSAEDETIKVFCWAANDHGQVGLPKDTVQYESPQLLAEGLADSGVGAKLSEHTCYIDAESRDSFAPVQFQKPRSLGSTGGGRGVSAGLGLADALADGGRAAVAALAVAEELLVGLGAVPPSAGSGGTRRRLLRRSRPAHRTQLAR